MNVVILQEKSSHCQIQKEHLLEIYLRKKLDKIAFQLDVALELASKKVFWDIALNTAKHSDINAIKKVLLQ